MRPDGRALRGVAATDEALDPALERRALHQDVAAAGLAPDADVRAQAVHEPRPAPARVRTPEADDVAQEQL
jgi:hypothetical protein